MKTTDEQRRAHAIVEQLRTQLRDPMPVQIELRIKKIDVLEPVQREDFDGKPMIDAEGNPVMTGTMIRAIGITCAQGVTDLEGQPFLESEVHLHLDEVHHLPEVLVQCASRDLLSIAYETLVGETDDENPVDVSPDFMT